MTIEDELLERLRANPLDEETRSVYADWLEQHGFIHRAAFLRAIDRAGRRAAALADPGDARWRAVVARQPLARCTTLYKQGCAIAWEHHARTEDDLRRQCATCQRAVFYFTELAELERVGAAPRCFTIDAALDEDEAKDRYDRVISS